jgi:hypothetical protein
VGAAALVRMFAAKRARATLASRSTPAPRSSRILSSALAEARYPCPIMRNTGFDVHAGSPKRRSPLAGATEERRVRRLPWWLSRSPPHCSRLTVQAPEEQACITGQHGFFLVVIEEVESLDDRS